MSLLLAERGMDVEILYCGWRDEVDKPWASRYRDAGVRVRFLDRSEAVSPAYVADSWRAFQALASRHYDTIVLQDWQGLGAVSGLAKRVGLAFGSTRLVHHVHGPTEWLMEANRSVELAPADAATAHLERLSAEYADVVVGPSAHLVSWMDEHGWRLPDERHTVPYFTSRHLEALDAPLAGARPSTPLTELVFFGRLEERKGVRTLAAAINRLDPALLRGITITFMGRPAHFQPEDVLAMFDDEAQDALADIRFLTDLDQPEARAYLCGPGRVALIPSHLDNSPNVVYECIEDRVPFLASHAGGTGELIAEGDRSATLFDPNPASMAALLAPLLAAGTTPPPARPSYDGPALMAVWERLLRPAETPAPIERTDDTFVTVVIPHHDRPEHLLKAVQSVALQDHTDLEILVVDDGSSSPTTLDLLDRLPAMFKHRRLRVVRQENRYLGAARNTGAREASADWLVFLDDDDELTPTCVSTMIRAQRRTGARIVSVGFDVVDGTTLDHNPHLHTWIFLGSGIHLGSMMNNLGGAGMLVAKEDLLAVGGFHERHGVGHEDWRLYVAFALSGRAVTAVPLPLYRYRIRPNSMIRSTSAYANSTIVNEVFAEHLPPALDAWPMLLRSMAEVIAKQRGRIEYLEGHVASLDEQAAEFRRLLAVRSVAARQR
ncbi:MAG: glycosyltransferase [Acidimicrobiales bacterium]|nr:glycosyltransferase [Acidimicrobiales bacterium]MCB9394901.1 glycosyltransferase [Acidimicrobiaceae bacterium]